MPEPAPLPQGYAPELDVRSVPWQSLRPHPRNPNNGDVEAIGESIEANGVYKPLVVAQDGTILVHHHVYYALGERGGGMVDVVVLPLDPFSDQAMRIMLGDNRIASLARPDEALTLEILEVLREHNALPGSGYEAPDVDEIASAIRRASHTPLNYHEEHGERVPYGSPDDVKDPPPPSQGGGLAGDAARYESKGLRYIMCEYPVSVYPAITAALKAKREEWGIDSNAEVVARLLGVDTSR